MMFKILPSCVHCGSNEGHFQIGCMCVCFCVTLQRVWALEGEQPGSGERGQWRGSTPRSRVHADHQTVGPQTHPQCHYREHHQEIWHTLSALSYTRRYLNKADCSFTFMHFGRRFHMPIWFYLFFFKFYSIDCNHFHRKKECSYNLFDVSMFRIIWGTKYQNILK